MCYETLNSFQGSSMNGVILGGNDNSKPSISGGDRQPTALQFRLECTDRNYEFLFENPQTCHLWATTITNLIMDRRDFAKGQSPLNKANLSTVHLVSLSFIRLQYWKW